MSDTSEYVVRIPEHFLDKLHEGEITASMLVTINILYRWANWTTGMVKHVSAGGLRTWSRKAYSTDTFSKALQRMELMGHITRLMTRGSHDDYPVVLHNYPKIDDTGKVVMINAKDTRTWQELQSGRSDEPHEETSDETSEETHDETSEKVLSNNLANNQSGLDSPLDLHYTAAAPPKTAAPSEPVCRATSKASQSQTPKVCEHGWNSEDGPCDSCPITLEEITKASHRELPEWAKFLEGD